MSGARRRTSLLDLADHLPGEAAEALLELATGGTPSRRRSRRPAPAAGSVRASRRAAPLPRDDQRRRSCERALDFPWEKWTVFLHPDAARVGRARYGGPARVSGSAGPARPSSPSIAPSTWRARTPTRACCSRRSRDTLAHALQTKLSRLIGNEPRVRRAHRRSVARSRSARDSTAGALRRRRPSPTRDDDADAARATRPPAVRPRTSSACIFLVAEWEQVVDAWQLDDLGGVSRRRRASAARRDCPRRSARCCGRSSSACGRRWQSAGTRHDAGRLPSAGRRISPLAPTAPFDFVVVDEAQDLSVPQLRFLAALGGDRPNALFFAGDLGQRIFQTPFSWKVARRGHPRPLAHAARQLPDVPPDSPAGRPPAGPEVTDVDGNTESRTGTISAFNGPEPVVRVLESREAEASTIADWLCARIADGVPPPKWRSS